jgi:hypothetical protein
MRASWWVGVVLLGAGLAGLAPAQRANTAGGRAGGQPVTNVPVINPAPPGKLGTFRNLASFFRKPTNPGGVARIGESPLPPPTAFKSTHYENKLNPFVPAKGKKK